MTTLFTRSQYLAAPIDGKIGSAHRRYFAQAVTPAVIRYVVDKIGAEEIARSKGGSLNEIPLARWDALHPTIKRLCAARVDEMSEGKGGYALSDSVCIAKEAARIWLDEQRERLFVGVFPAGISYADRSREEFGDYKRLAFLPFRSLVVEFAVDCPAGLRALITRDAAVIQARRGEDFQVSTSGQTVRLGAGP